MSEIGEYFEAHGVLKTMLLGEHPDESKLPVQRIGEATALVAALVRDPGKITPETARDALREFARASKVAPEVARLAEKMANYTPATGGQLPHEVAAALDIDGTPNRNDWYVYMTGEGNLSKEQLAIYTRLAPQP